jgi:hypothetical protein
MLSDLCLPHVSGRLQSVSPPPLCLLIGLHSTGCKCKLINFNQCNLRVYIEDQHFCGHASCLPPSVRRNFVLCPRESLLKFGVPWVKKRLRNNVLNK